MSARSHRDFGAAFSHDRHRTALCISQDKACWITPPPTPVISCQCPGKAGSAFPLPASGTDALVSCTTSILGYLRCMPRKSMIGSRLKAASPGQSQEVERSSSKPNRVQICVCRQKGSQSLALLTRTRTVNDSVGRPLSTRWAGACSMFAQCSHPGQPRHRETTPCPKPRVDACEQRLNCAGFRELFAEQPSV